MEDKANDKNNEDINENEFDADTPIEFIERKSNKSKTPSSDEREKDAYLEKFKKGELGAEHIRYNDDGPPFGSSRKLDIDTHSDPK